MNCLVFRLSFCVLLHIPLLSIGQVIRSQILDTETKEAIPYVLVTINKNQGVSADGEGFFEIDTSRKFKENDSLKLISLGYKSLKLPLKKAVPLIIHLQKETITMDEVVITTSKYSLEEILENVAEKIKNNYDTDLSKKELFFRQKDNNKISKLNIDFKKSTIKEITQEYVNEELEKMPKTSAFYTEVYGNWYGNNKKQKLDINKAAKFFDTYNNNHLDVFYEKLETILNKNIKKDSYFKIKSGLFSVKADGVQGFFENGELLDMRNEMSKKEEVNANFFLTNRKQTLQKMVKDVFYNSNSPLNFIKKTSRYDFEIVGTVEINEQLAYEINFFPNGGEDFKGTFYVNKEDFAILRIDYQNVKHLRSIGLLGLSFKELGRKGMMFFEKGNNNKYHLKYLERTEEDKYGIDRPLKIIEKNKNIRGRRKQNEISSDIDFVSNVVREYQIWVYDYKTITENTFEGQNENKKEQPKNWIKYNPEFWQNHSKVSHFSSDLESLKQY